MCKDYISRGFEYLVEFEKNYIPIYTYKIEDVIIKKYICMEYGKKTIGVYYKIQSIVRTFLLFAQNRKRLNHIRAGQPYLLLGMGSRCNGVHFLIKELVYCKRNMVPLRRH